MNSYEKRFYADIHKLVEIQGGILEELKKLNKPFEDWDEVGIELTEKGLEQLILEEMEK